MWFLPILVIGAIAVAAASRSPREGVSPSRQLALPPPSRQLTPPVMSGPPGLPGPISVLGEILRIGKYPPPKVILCAIAEAEAIGRPDLVSDIVNAFVAPVVYQSCAQTDYAWMPQAPAYERGSCMPSRAQAWMPQPPAYERGSCTPSRSFRAQAWMPRPPAYDRGSCAPSRSSRAQADYDYAYVSCAPRHDRGSCSPRAQADYAHATCSPRESGVPSSAVPQAAAPQVAARQPSEEEILSMLHADPKIFIDMVAAQQTRRGPLVEVFPIGSSPMAAAESSTSQTSSSQTQSIAPSPVVNTNMLAEQLLQLPGHAGAGVVMDPSSGAEVFEVRGLRGYPAPALPQTIDGRPVSVVIDDSLPIAQPMGLPSETVAQMQEAAGLPEAADRTRALAAGSPIAGVSDDAWRQFVMRLERESPSYNSSRHVGQYRQRRERLADLGIDPRTIHGSAAAQRAALDADLADAHHHAAAGGVLSEHLGRSVVIPGREGAETITLSGLLGVIQCAGLDGAVGWLERPNDRKRYPHTTQAFINSNGVF